MKLLLFDIDGTLIHSGGAGRRAMHRAFEQVYGIEDGFKDISMYGKTDPLILREALANHRIEWRREEADRFKALYLQFLRKGILTPTPKRRIMPGAVELLEEVSKRPNLIRGLLTGNWREGAEIKLGFFDLNRYFELGAYADDSEIREELVPIAVKRCEELKGIELEPEQVYIIGDTPLDILCARPFGAKTIVVATGIHTEEELLAERPDHFFPDLREYTEIVKIFS
ncbi:MAG: HAD family hydrolase [bacterium]